MSRLTDLINQFDKDLRGSGNDVAVTPDETIGAPDIDNAHSEVAQTHLIREEWADVVLSLAQSQDWPSVEFKKGHKVVSGEYGWRLFCGRANLTRLRDQTYPALMARSSTERPCSPT